MIDRYLEQGDMFVMFNSDKQAMAVAVVAVKDSKTVELKNLAVAKTEQGKGFGRLMLTYISDFYAEKFETLLVGTGDVQKTVGFYEHCGFFFRIESKTFLFKTTIIRFLKMA